ncbi:MAG: SUMF1/EgtB/PvdO family nonheme iron enzyme, partial [Anaerolineae bacterium]
NEPVLVLLAQPLSGGRVKIYIVGLHSNASREHILGPTQLAQIKIAEGPLRDFSGDAAKAFLAVEAARIRSAYQFDPLFAINISQVEPLPHQIEAVYHYILRNPRLRFLLADDPGAGKTTFLKYLALKLAAGEWDELGLGAYLPVLVPLSAYANELAGRDVRLDDFIAGYFHHLGADLPIGEMLKEALAKGNALVLLDGLDEVKELALRHTVVQRVVDFYTFHRRAGNKFVLTSRIIGYREARPAAIGLNECTLVDFDDEEIKAFVAKWTAAIERAARGDTPVAAQEAERERLELLETVHRNPGVRRLAANPLLLTILTLMKRQGVRLPERRVELYDKYVETLLSSWNRAQGLGRPPARDLYVVETVRILAPLALWMHEVNPGVGLVKQRELERKLIAIYSERGEAVADAWPGGVTSACKEKVVGALVETLRDEKVKVPLRAAAGRALARLGDPRPGVCTLPPDWVEIPAGPFIMGDGSEQREVNISYDYRISRYPITNAQYEMFVKAGGYAERRYWTEAGWRWKGDRIEPDRPGQPYNLLNHPVVYVSWYEALAFCRWLTDYLRERGEIGEGEEVRLPSEAEWEKAARGTDGREWPWGNKFDSALCNMAGTGIGATSAVGIFPAGKSPYEVLDMAGNVWEWTRSISRAYPYSPKDGRENLEAGADVFRVLRGGSFNFYHDYVRCAFRGGGNPGVRGDGYGFRVVLSPSSNL